MRFAGAAIGIVVIGITSSPSYAYKPPRSYIRLLTPTTIEAAIRCDPETDAFSKDVDARFPPGPSKGALIHQAYKDEFDGVLERCGFSAGLSSWNDTWRSIWAARGIGPIYKIKDENGELVEGKAALRILNFNRRSITPYRKELEPLLQRLMGKNIRE